MRTFYVLLFLLCFSNCSLHSLTNRKMKDVLNAITLFHYHFQDSSVPPPYHRSYSISADSKNVQVQVFRYGDTLATETYALPDSALQRIGQALLDNNISQHKVEKKLKGCTGGVGHKIEYTSVVDSTIFSVRRYECGGNYEGDLKGDVQQFLKDIAFLAPVLDTLIKSTQ